MVKVFKDVSDIENLYTFYEFVGFGEWDDFEVLQIILTKYLRCKVTESFDGIYSRHCYLKKGKLAFELLHHEDFGNCLCSNEKKDEDYYNALGDIAEATASHLNAINK